MKKRPCLTAMSTAAIMLLAVTGFAADHPIYSISYDSGSDGPDFPSADTALDNDFTRINEVVSSDTLLADGDTITLYGSFDWSEAGALASYITAEFKIVPAAIPNITVQGDSANGAEVLAVYDPDDSVVTKWQRFLSVESSSSSGWTVQDLTLKNFERFIYWKSGSSHNYWTVQENTFHLIAYRENYSLEPYVSGSVVGLESFGTGNDAFNVLDNTFYIVVNAGDYDGPDGENRGLNSGAYGMFTHAGQRIKNGTITGNEFLAMFEDKDGSGTVEADERYISTAMTGIFENSNTSTGILTIANNLFDGTVQDGNGNDMKGGFYAVWPTHRPNMTDPSISNTIYTGNTFKNFYVCYFPFTFSPNTENHVLLMGAETFIDCGYNDPANPVENFYLSSSLLTDGELLYAPAFRNAAGGAWAGAGGSSIQINDLDNFSWNGQTGIPMLNAVANDGRCFEAIPLENGESAQVGIYGVTVDPPAITTYYNSQWDYTNRFDRPTPEVAEDSTDLSGVELAFGYNAFGDPIDAGDPDELIVNADPTADGDGDDSLLTIVITEDTEIAPGTVVDKNTRIMAGPPIKADRPVLTPKIKSMTQALFDVSTDGVSLTIEGLELNGDNLFVGPYDILSAVNANGSSSAAGISVTLEDCLLKNFYGEAVAIGTGSQATIDNSLIEYSRNVIKERTGTESDGFTVTNNLIQHLFSNAFVLRRSDYEISKNVFTENDHAEIFLLSWPFNGIIMHENLFFDAFTVTGVFTTRDGYGVPSYMDFTNNWHNIIYGEGVNDDQGLVIGDQDLARLGSYIPVEAGIRTHDSFFNLGTLGFIETDIIAQFDRDLDALPDAWEIGKTTDYTSFDTDNDGWPDGVEVANGTLPDDNSDYPAGTFEINVDVDMNGIADWYEAALLANCGIPPFIGNVEGQNGVGLTDAVRALQIVNGAFGGKDMLDGDLNALDVTALGPNSLGNPLQILRFQAGVRNKLPALSGID